MKIRMLIPLIIFLNSPLLSANFIELFGSGPHNRAIGNQSDGDKKNPANNFYIPSLMAWNKSVNLAFSSSLATPSFEAIENITIRNSTNNFSSTAPTTGNANTTYSSTTIFGINANLPIVGLGNVTLSLFLPIGTLMETNSGNPYLPEYVMYRSRNKRTLSYFSYSHPFTESFSMSLGAQLGFQAGGNATAQGSLQGETLPSSASAKVKVEPVLGPIVSFFYKIQEGSNISFTWQKEIKSKMRMDTIVETGNNLETISTLGIESVIFYDPHFFRLGYHHRFKPMELFTTLEYQSWGNYKTPKIEMTAEGILNASDDSEKIKIKNIFVPKIGARFLISDPFSISLGASYRPTPLNSDFSGAGNSIDTNSLIFSSGFNWNFKIFKKLASLGGSLQYHSLEENKVTKSPLQENGVSGNKIGSPGYTVGGNILAVSLGIKVQL